MPVGFTFDQPAPGLSAWDQQAKARKPPRVLTPQRPPQPPSHPLYPTKQPWALRWLEPCKMAHPGIRGHWIVADALYGTAPCVDGASARFSGVQGISHA